MTIQQKALIRCAIYTRKSSEEGLEQSFNSLDAQREACEAYIVSQRHEGWRAVPTSYDDGGYSGGDMGRPALKQLLEDVKANKVDTIVVYKVDRLTRSLADFAKIVETLDACGVSFVSVTQQFNTTTSMGRLTLNILLSFAQFEREVAGERIRDKVAASKRKGMWMGGTIPLGYDVLDRKLVMNEEDAELVNNIYKWYLELGSVSKLRTYLDERGVKTKMRVSSTGCRSGGGSFFRGALYLILQNRTYLGEVVHQKQCYPGQQKAIVLKDLWDRVQAQLRSDNGGRRNDIRANCSSMLLGLLQDVDGNRFRPSHTVKNGKRYRYYFIQMAGETFENHIKAVRLPAYDIERQISASLQSFLRSTKEVMNGLSFPNDDSETLQRLIRGAGRLAEELSAGGSTAGRGFVRKVIRRIVVRTDNLEIEMSRSQLRASLSDEQSRVPQHQEPDDSIRIRIEARLKRCGKEMRLVISPDSSKRQKITPLLKAVVRAHQWRKGVLAGEVPNRKLAANRLNLKQEYFRRVLGCAFLAPDIIEAILDGNYPSDLTVKKLCWRQLPIDWAEQRIRLGFSARPLQSMR
jgi:site-specific DNA recombinase